MAAEAPDPKTFGSWEEAFQYPIPAVRGMEKQLRRDIDSNREKLRTLVGYGLSSGHLASVMPVYITQLLTLWDPCSASYRDLLGTAESIIEMGVQMDEVESYMGEIGKRCNTRILDKKASNLRTWTEEVGAPSTKTSEKSTDLWRRCL